jgi:hypothetical protein
MGVIIVELAPSLGLLQRFALTWNPRKFLKAALRADEQKFSCK